MSKSITLEIGDRAFSLRLDMTALRDLAEFANVDLLSGGKDAQAAMQDTRNIGTVLWCLCGGEDTGLSAREFGRLIPVEELPAAMLKIQEMFTRDLADTTEGGGGGKAKAA